VVVVCVPEFGLGSLMCAVWVFAVLSCCVLCVGEVGLRLVGGRLVATDLRAFAVRVVVYCVFDSLIACGFCLEGCFCFCCCFVSVCGGSL